MSKAIACTLGTSTNTTMRRRDHLSGGNDDNASMDNRIPLNELAATRSSLARFQALQAAASASQPSTTQEHQAQQNIGPQSQSAVANFLAGARQNNPNLPSSLFRQQHEPMMSHGGLLAGIGSDPAVAMLRRQEDQLLASRLLLQQQQLDELLSPGVAAAGARSSAATLVNPMLSQRLLGSPNIDQSERSQAAIMASQGLLSSKDVRASDNVSSLLGATLDSKTSGKVTMKTPESSSSSEEEKDEPKGQAAANDDGSNAGVDKKGDDTKNPVGSGATENFPFKLYRILEEAESYGKDDIVSFLSHGRAFTIHKPRQFVSEIMPKYFTTSRMSSFQRQLNLYGFRRITEGRDKGSYFHDFFLKGKRKLCKKIKRKKTSVKPPPDIFGGLGLPQIGTNVASFGSHQELLMRQALAGVSRADPSVNPASSLSQSLLTSAMLGGGTQWNRFNPAIPNQAVTNQAVAAFLEQQQAQQAANNQLLLQELQRKQILEELERQRREFGGG